MVVDVEISAEPWVFVFKRVEAVRAGGDDFFELLRLENLNIAPRQKLEQIFVAHTSGGVAGAAFSIAEDGKIDIGALQEASKGARDFLMAAI